MNMEAKDKLILITRHKTQLPFFIQFTHLLFLPKWTIMLLKGIQTNILSNFGMGLLIITVPCLFILSMQISCKLQVKISNILKI